MRPQDYHAKMEEERRSSGGNTNRQQRSPLRRIQRAQSPPNTYGLLLLANVVELTEALAISGNNGSGIGAGGQGIGGGGVSGGQGSGRRVPLNPFMMQSLERMMSSRRPNQIQMGGLGGGKETRNAPRRPGNFYVRGGAIASAQAGDPMYLKRSRFDTATQPPNPVSCALGRAPASPSPIYTAGTGQPSAPQYNMRTGGSGSILMDHLMRSPSQPSSREPAPSHSGWRPMGHSSQHGNSGVPIQQTQQSRYVPRLQAPASPPWSAGQPPTLLQERPVRYVPPAIMSGGVVTTQAPIRRLVSSRPMYSTPVRPQQPPQQPPSPPVFPFHPFSVRSGSTPTPHHQQQITNNPHTPPFYGTAATAPTGTIQHPPPIPPSDYPRIFGEQVKETLWLPSGHPNLRRIRNAVRHSPDITQVEAERIRLLRQNFQRTYPPNCEFNQQRPPPRNGEEEEGRE